MLFADFASSPETVRLVRPNAQTETVASEPHCAPVFLPLLIVVPLRIPLFTRNSRTTFSAFYFCLLPFAIRYPLLRHCGAPEPAVRDLSRPIWKLRHLPSLVRGEFLVSLSIFLSPLFSSSPWLPHHLEDVVAKEALRSLTTSFDTPFLVDMVTPAPQIRPKLPISRQG